MSFLSNPVRELAERRYFGLDLAKRETQLAVLDAGGGQIQQKRFATKRENFLALAAELTGDDTVALEVTTNAIAIARLIRDNSEARVIISNPFKTKIIAKSKIKTDKIDARVLAELARVDYLPEVWLPDEDTESLRQFVSDRISLVRRRTECKNTVHSVLHRNLVRPEYSDLYGVAGRRWLEGVVAASADKLPIPQLDRLRIGSLLNEIDRMDALVEDLESVIASFIAVRPSLKDQTDRLLSITGVDLVVASGLLAAIGDVHRFPDKKKLAAYFGVVPSTRQSGDTSRNGRITKQGRAEARWLVIEAAEHLRKAPGPMHALYDRVARKKNHNVAVVAVARKLVELVHRLLTRKEDFIYRNPQRTMDKRSRFRQLAKKKIGVAIKSATAKIAGRTALYGADLGIKGSTLKKEISRTAAHKAERLYQAIVQQRAAHLKDPGAAPLFASDDLVFDPTQPKEVDWEKILKQAAEKLIKKKMIKTATA
jgi:transposase